MFDDELDIIVNEDEPMGDDSGDFIVEDDSPAQLGEQLDKSAAALETPVETSSATETSTVTDAATETTLPDYGTDEAVPADWQQQVQQLGWDNVTNEQGFYEAVRTQQYIHHQYQSDPGFQQLHALVNAETTPDIELVRYEIQQQLGEWADEADVEEVMAKFQDDEGNLTDKGIRRAATARQKLTQQFNHTLNQWASDAQQELTAERTFFQTLRDKLNADARLDNAARQQVYQYIRSGKFGEESQIDPRNTDAASALDRALWSNPATRQSLLRPLLEKAEKEGASKVLQQLLQ